MPPAPSVFAPPAGASSAGAGGGPSSSGAGGAGPLGSIQQARLADLLETVRKEFELMAGDAGGWKRERDDMESKIALQIQETALIRQNLYDLEAQHVKIRQEYEAEITHLRRELEVARSSPSVSVSREMGALKSSQHQQAHQQQLQQHQHQQQQQQQQQQPLPVLPQSSTQQPQGGGMHSPRRDRVDDRRGLQGPSGGFMSGPLGASGGPPSSTGAGHHASSHPPPSAGSVGAAGAASLKKDPLSGGQLPAIGSGLSAANGGGPTNSSHAAGVSLPSMQASALPPAQAPPAPLTTTTAGSPPPPLPASSAAVGRPSSASSPKTTPAPGAGGTAGPLPSMLSPLPAAAQPTSAAAAAAAATAGGRLPAPSTPQPFAPNPPPPPTRAPAPTPTAAIGSASSPAPSQQQVVVASDIDPEVARPELKKEGTDWVVFWSPKAGRQVDVSLVHTLPHESIVCCVKFSHDGKWLATGCNRTVQIYDALTGAKACVLQDDNTAAQGDLYIRTICFSPDGRFLATGAEDRQIRIWDVGKRAIRHLLQGHSQEIYSLDFSSDGRHLVSGSGDQSARIWDIETGQCTFDLKVEDTVISDAGAVDAGLTSVAVSPDGKLVAAGSLDAIVRVWDAQTGAQLGRLLGHSNSVYSVAFSPDGSALCSGSLDCSIRIWDLSAPPPVRAPGGKADALPNGEAGSGFGSCQTILKGHKDYVLSVGVTNDGRWVVSGSKDRGVQFYDTKTKAVQLLLQGHKNSVISIDLSKNSGLLATGSGDLNARIWSYSPAAGGPATAAAGTAAGAVTAV